MLKTIEEKVTGYTQFEANVANPDFGRGIGHQTPGQARVGVRFTF